MKRLLASLLTLLMLLTPASAWPLDGEAAPGEAMSPVLQTVGISANGLTDPADAHILQLKEVFP